MTDWLWPVTARESSGEAGFLLLAIVCQCKGLARDVARLANGSLPGYQHGASGNQDHADRSLWRQALAKEPNRENGDGDDLQLVDRCAARRIADRERLKIAQPGRAGGKARQYEKQPSAAGNGRYLSEAGGGFS